MSQWTSASLMPALRSPQKMQRPSSVRPRQGCPNFQVPRRCKEPPKDVGNFERSLRDISTWKWRVAFMCGILFKCTGAPSGAMVIPSYLKSFWSFRCEGTMVPCSREVRGGSMYATYVITSLRASYVPATGQLNISYSTDMGFWNDRDPGSFVLFRTFSAYSKDKIGFRISLSPLGSYT